MTHISPIEAATMAVWSDVHILDGVVGEERKLTDADKAIISGSIETLQSIMDRNRDNDRSH